MHFFQTSINLVFHNYIITLLYFPYDKFYFMKNIKNNLYFKIPKNSDRVKSLKHDLDAFI